MSGGVRLCLISAPLTSIHIFGPRALPASTYTLSVLTILPQLIPTHSLDQLQAKEFTSPIAPYTNFGTVRVRELDEEGVMEDDGEGVEAVVDGFEEEDFEEEADPNPRSQIITCASSAAKFTISSVIYPHPSV